MTTDSEDLNLIPLIYPTLISPILDKLEARNDVAVQLIRNALESLEKNQPGFLLEFCRQLLKLSSLNNVVNLQETFLRLQAELPVDNQALRHHPESAGIELNYRAVNLRKMLAKIPDEIGDRRKFLDTIKEIASAIKKLLDATNIILDTSEISGKHVLDQRKREFVKYSKRFSNTLKQYFRGGEVNSVCISANHLVYHTNMIVKTVKDMRIS